METYSVFPYEYPISMAEQKCKERYGGFKVLSKTPTIMFPHKNQYMMCYAYFRWFDDIVDSRKQSHQDINYIIDRQKRFLEELYSQGIPEEIATEELFLAHIIMFD